MPWSKRQQIEYQRRMLKALNDAAYASELETAKWLSNMQIRLLAGKIEVKPMD